MVLDFWTMNILSLSKARVLNLPLPATTQHLDARPLTNSTTPLTTDSPFIKGSTIITTTTTSIAHLFWAISIYKFFNAPIESYV